MAHHFDLFQQDLLKKRQSMNQKWNENMLQAKNRLQANKKGQMSREGHKRLVFGHSETTSSKSEQLKTSVFQLNFLCFH